MALSLLRDPRVVQVKSSLFVKDERYRTSCYLFPRYATESRFWTTVIECFLRICDRIPVDCYCLENLRA